MVQPTLETSAARRSGLSCHLERGGRFSQVKPVESTLLGRVNHLTLRKIRPARERSISKFRRIVLLTDMRDEQHLEPGGVCVIQKLPSLSIGQVTKIAAYPFLHSIGIRPIGQHLRIVIKLEHQCIAAGKRVHNVRRDTAQVGEHTQLEIVVSQAKLHRLPGIVRDGLSGDVDIAHRELIAGSNQYTAS